MSFRKSLKRTVLLCGMCVCVVWKSVCEKVCIANFTM